jgi:hypothetical protein
MSGDHTFLTAALAKVQRTLDSRLDEMIARLKADGATAEAIEFFTADHHSAAAQTLAEAEAFIRGHTGIGATKH